MSTPEFIREIRASGAGRRLLLLPGVTAVVFDDEGRVLLGRRADTGRWSVVGGIAEPGEQPAETAVREVYEETAVRCVPERVVLVQMLEPVTYANGDVCQYQDITFRCRATGGQARAADGELLEVAWFAPDGLPPLEPFALRRIHRSLAEEPTWFEVPDPA
ncbi:ADP-ribose pyrophosphatase YjhB (NUDIX family) [Streptomyces sp. 3211.6]|uniref:NUDIX hydrolase n=1 Tax=Streptomyces TaxID=1883 RepID=UPI0009A4F056|nr:MULTISPECIES: NUDIX domain-containing protein [Streptomyces]RKT03201.1 ADP-ribose pyrophosphatase YjhB (NUDIX family) [Streptomyces sp. 3211.6]RPF29378.1 ADP-ribose pyrophosphatase YjhB (NUDIX family) [Streptomyces sp. Ag109_G2-6]